MNVIRLFLPATCLIALAFPALVHAQSSVNEALATNIVYAAPAPAGNDANNGLTVGTPKTLNGAIGAIGTKSTKLILLDGDYRQWVNLPSGNNVLVVQAQNAGQAAISGSDIFTNWTSLGGGLYTVPWTNKWGLASPGFGGLWVNGTAYNVRMEMVFIDGAPLLQKCDTNGNPVATGTLAAGQFTVNETNNVITFYPLGGTLSSANKVEVSTRGNTDNLFNANNHNNLVLRGLVFRHHAGAVNQHAAANLQGTGGNGNPNHSVLATNLLVEDCLFALNNAVGLNMATLGYVSLNRVNASTNGSRGSGFFATQHGRVTDCQFNANNWRTGWPNIGNDAAGFKMFDGQLNEYTDTQTGDIQFLRCAFKNNLSVGLWQDYDGTNTVVDSCLFENNEWGGIDEEMTPGPLTIRNCVIRNNGYFSLSSYGSPNITLTNTYLYGARITPLYGQTDPQYCAEFYVILDSRTNSALGGNGYGSMSHWVITNCTIQATFTCTNGIGGATATGGETIFYGQTYGANPNNPPKLSLINTLTSNSNRWWRAAGEQAGVYNSNTNAFFDLTDYNNWQDSYTIISFNQWTNQSNTLGKQDRNSVWGHVSLTN
ncbi:MAG: right-handed parallel beta-helix repeat-containing protein, partial [Verrucomicrobiota bacterium]